MTNHAIGLAFHLLPDLADWERELLRDTELHAWEPLVIDSDNYCNPKINRPLIDDDAWNAFENYYYSE